MSSNWHIPEQKCFITFETNESRMKLIVDSGSTKADWVLIQADGSRLDFASAGINSFWDSAFNWYF